VYALYKIKSDGLNKNLIAAIKAQLPHQAIEISISEISQIDQDETTYLLANPAKTPGIASPTRNPPHPSNPS
jgi:hypothetical protein